MIISDFQPKHLTVFSAETACNQFSCPNGMQCAIDERHNPVCVCAKTCPYSTDIVCGTDGRTYGSECELFKEACASANNIRVAYKGYCLEGKSTFEALNALPFENK